MNVRRVHKERPIDVVSQWPIKFAFVHQLSAQVTSYRFVKCNQNIFRVIFDLQRYFKACYRFLEEISNV